MRRYSKKVGVGQAEEAPRNEACRGEKQEP